MKSGDTSSSLIILYATGLVLEVRPSLHISVAHPKKQNPKQADGSDGFHTYV